MRQITTAGEPDPLTLPLLSPHTATEALAEPFHTDVSDEDHSSRRADDTARIAPVIRQPASRGAAQSGSDRRTLAWTPPPADIETSPRRS